MVWHNVTVVPGGAASLPVHCAAHLTLLPVLANASARRAVASDSLQSTKGARELLGLLLPWLPRRRVPRARQRLLISPIAWCLAPECGCAAHKETKRRAFPILACLKGSRGPWGLQVGPRSQGARLRFADCPDPARLFRAAQDAWRCARVLLPLLRPAVCRAAIGALCLPCTTGTRLRHNKQQRAPRARTLTRPPLPPPPPPWRPGEPGRFRLSWLMLGSSH